MSTIAKAWLALMALTAGTLAVVSLASHHLPHGLLAFTVFTVAGVKAWLILVCFVGIGRDARGWRTILVVYLMILCGLLVAFNAVSCASAGL
ncbi:cytochrome C oxidase subunit IV family protein [Tianweitania sp.]|uniref:cytochrome C oxidase subunit IV family protein n=1 Tax=Tianweitania sp. TaxID=2021634 RepID=UPI002897956A|nr:cytochrome C oxidase subunit IV family protein [Tianweitania sp.]